jgi:glutamate 5-kinase
MPERKKDLVVVKYDSSSVTYGHGMDRRRLDEYAERIGRLKRVADVIIVSSGSVKAGEAIWRRGNNDPIVGDNLPYAMLGSASVVTSWQEALGKQGLLAGQLPVTHKEIRSEAGELHQSLTGSLDRGIVPVVNENGALSQEELARLAYGGDNDGIAANIATLMGASALFLLTDKKGLLKPSDYLVREVAANDADWDRARGYIDYDPQEDPTNGMQSKVKAAIWVAQFGIDAYIASANASFEAITRQPDGVGTHFVALNEEA